MLEKKIASDYLAAMKSREALKSSVLSFLRADLMNAQVAKKKNSLDDSEVVAIVKKQIKQRQESIEAFTKGSRPEMAQKEEAELLILKSYLPPEMPVEKVKQIIAESMAATAAAGMKDMGRLMKEVNAQIAGQADGKLVSDLVREALTKGA